MKWSGGIKFMNKPWVCFFSVFFFVVVLFQTLKFSVYTELNKLSSITFSETHLFAVLKEVEPWESCETTPSLKNLSPSLCEFKT